jgi:hypothetical protein
MTSIDETVAGTGNFRQADEMPELMARLAVAYDMKSIAYLGTGTLDRRLARCEPHLAVTYSSEWVERHRARGYLKIDPLIQVGPRRLLPVDWDEFEAEDRELRPFLGEAAEFGLGCKVMSFPVHRYAGDRALFSIAAELSEREWQWLTGLPSGSSRSSLRISMTQCCALKACSAPTINIVGGSRHAAHTRHVPERFS